MSLPLFRQKSNTQRIPVGVNEWCLSHGWTDPFYQSSKYWGFPPGSVVPQPLPVQIHIPSKFIKVWDKLNDRVHFLMARILVILILATCDPRSSMWLGLFQLPFACEIANMFVWILYLCQIYRMQVFNASPDTIKLKLRGQAIMIMQLVIFTAYFCPFN